MMGYRKMLRKIGKLKRDRGSDAEKLSRIELGLMDTQKSYGERMGRLEGRIDRLEKTGRDATVEVGMLADLLAGSSNDIVSTLRKLEIKMQIAIEEREPTSDVRFQPLREAVADANKRMRQSLTGKGPEEETALDNAVFDEDEDEG